MVGKLDTATGNPLVILSFYPFIAKSRNWGAGDIQVGQFGVTDIWVECGDIG